MTCLRKYVAKVLACTAACLSAGLVALQAPFRHAYNILLMSSTHLLAVYVIVCGCPATSHQCTAQIQVLSSAVLDHALQPFTHAGRS